MNRTRRRVLGATMIEVAITLPLLLGSLGFMFWYIFRVDQTTALTSSMINAARLSATRANPAKLQVIDDQLTLSGLFPDMDRVASLEMADLSGTPLYSAFYSSDENGDEYQGHYLESGVVTGNAYGIALKDMPPIFRYLIAYTHLQMKEALGGRVRYPCDPALPESLGCLQCFFINPLEPPPATPADIIHVCRSEGSEVICTGGQVDLALAPNLIGLECRYSLDQVTFRFVRNLLATLGISIGEEEQEVQVRRVYHDLLRESEGLLWAR